MKAESRDRIPPIKLKLSLRPKPEQPRQTQAAAASPRTIRSRKGKEKEDKKARASGEDDDVVPGRDLKAPEVSSNRYRRVSKPDILPQPGSLPDLQVILGEEIDSSEPGPSTAPHLSLKSSAAPTPPLDPPPSTLPSPGAEPSSSSADVTTTPSIPLVNPTREIPKSTGKQPKGAIPNTETRLSAIPPRLITPQPSTPRSSRPTSLPATTPDPPQQPQVKVEDGIEERMDNDPDPISLTMSPSAAQVATPKENAEETDTPVTGKGKGGGRWLRLRRPLRELLEKIMFELRRKDEYALFGSPVNLDDFSDYIDIVGGEAKMMDLGTMQSKIDNRQYKSIDQFETDLRTLVTAAEAYNPIGTIPYTSAARLLALGLKHIERARPLVRTPSPSPEPRPSADRASVSSAREATALNEERSSRRPLSDIPPQYYIPEEMLMFPPNSLHALAVGWNLTGGKRVYARRQIRGREKFQGKWRHWEFDGSRDLAEMDEPEEVFEPVWRLQSQATGQRMTDWKGSRKDAWWDWDGLGGPNGQPPLSFNSPRPPILRTRELGAFDWGVYPEIVAEMAYLAKRTGVVDDSEVISEHLRPLRPRRAAQPANFTNAYDEPLGREAWHFLRDVCNGDVRGEAYIASIERFVQGAMKNTSTSTRTNITSNASVELDKYVHDNWRNDVLQSQARTTVQNTLSSMHHLKALQPSKKSGLVDSARRAYHRLSLRNMTSPSNPLDIAPLLRQADDFLYEGEGGQEGIKRGLQYVADEIIRLNQEIMKDKTGKRRRGDGDVETGGGMGKRIKLENGDSPVDTKPLAGQPDSSRNSGTEPEASTEAEDALKRVRLELISLSKFYPLAALKKMDKTEAQRFLPENVRKLMTRK